MHAGMQLVRHAAHLQRLAAALGGAAAARAAPHLTMETTTCASKLRTCSGWRCGMRGHAAGTARAARQ
jgi:hypothetical protein